MDEDNLSFPAMELISSGRLLHSKGQHQEAHRDFLNAFAIFKEALGYDHDAGIANCDGKTIDEAEKDLYDAQWINDRLFTDLYSPNSSASIQNLVRAALSSVSNEDDDSLVAECKLSLPFDEISSDSNLDWGISA
jgi:hypothetical protein